MTVKLKEKSTRVSFTPMTGGKSMYITKDEELQNAIERHSWFGKIFFLLSEEEEKQPAEVKEEKAVNKKTLRVSCIDDAKDYLADVYGVSRTKMRSVEAIKVIAEEKGVIFEGI